MSDKTAIRTEIESAIKIRDPELLKKVESELDMMEVTEGLGGKYILEVFHKIWKQNKEQVGTKNDINSWTAYAIGMTTKPTGDFLPLRRAFARAGFPDVDTDFDDERRDEVYDYLIQKYGRENVGNIGTYIKQKMKAAVRNTVRAVDAARAFHRGKEEATSANYELANEINRSLAVNPTGVIKAHDEGGKEVVVKTIKKAYEYVPEFHRYMDKYPEVYRYSQAVEGLVGSASQHAAGIVISDVPLAKIAPLRETKKGYATQYAMEDLESIGLIKFDILAIAALTVIRDACEAIESNYGIKLDMEKLPLDDKKTLQLYRDGKLNGVFQFENGGMQQTAREMGIDRFEDIMVCVALYRPGPMDSIPEYIARKKGTKKINYFHPSIEPFVKKHLENTYGVICYQESLMQICNSLAGFSITDGYVMIKAVGKKKKYLLDKFEKQFIAGGVNNKVPESIMKEYWDKFIIPFANYAFNVAHACCYGFLSYQTAYLKANYPDEFACAFMNTFVRRAVRKSASSWDDVDMMEKDSQRTLGIKVLPRTLTDCSLLYKIAKKKDLSKGVMQTEVKPTACCKGMGWGAAKNVAENGPYNNVDDLARKTDMRLVTIESVSALIDAGFMRGKVGQKQKEQIIEKFTKIRKGIKAARDRGINPDASIFT